MLPDTSPTQNTSSSGQENSVTITPTITPELIRKITERVYALLQADLRIERERQRLSRQNLRPQKARNPTGGRYGL